MGKVIVAIVAVAILGGIFFFTQSDKDTDNTATESSSTAQTTDATFTEAEVASHNTESDCWTIINSSVYDITEYVSRHPGGDEILRACGTDATTLFETRTTEEGEEVGSGEPHSQSAHSQLETLKIGKLQ